MVVSAVVSVKMRHVVMILTTIYACVVLQEEEVRKEMAAAQEGLAAAHKDVEADRDRFKKVIQELKKKLDRYIYMHVI